MEILSDLNPIQQQAVTFDSNRPLVILAGAGSGKTRILTYRAAHLIDQEKISPENILLLTFTNKAAEEMIRRVSVLLNAHSSMLNRQTMGGTFHSFAARVLRKYGTSVGVSDRFVIYDSGDQVDAIKQAFNLLGVDSKTTKPQGVLAAISDAKNNMVTAGEYGNYAKGNFQQMVARVYMVYQQLLNKYNALDFDDLLLKTVQLLQTDKEVLENLQNLYQYILVDEYQDTNKAQYEITKLLAKKHQHITAVGDAAQAIYSWRGADYRNLLYLKRDFPDLTTIQLEQNYRSTQNILDGANNVIIKNKNHPVLKLWTERGSGEKITIYEAESETEEAEFIIKKILNAYNLQLNKYSDYAVLYRTNAQSRVLEEALLHAGIPYSLFGGVRFYERREIKDILAYLKILVNPEDEISRKRAEKLGKRKLQVFDGYMAEWLDGYQTKNTLEILDETIKVTEYLDQYDPMNEEDAGRLENIKELRSVAATYSILPEFLEKITLTEKESRKTGEHRNGAVTLMTMHSAKGLEFKTVFMVGMEEGLFPHSRTLMNPDEMEEERRLCYVGMTRAMDKLYMTYAVRRLFFGTRTNNMVSRFLGDIPQELIQSDKVIKVVKHVSENFGFDAEGNWQWSPED